MEKIRIGKDFTIEWAILTNGDPISLDGRDLRLEMHTPSRKSIIIPFTTSGIDINVRISPDLQTSLGKYYFTLWENYGKDGQTMVDSCDAFQLVDNTNKEGKSGCGCATNIQSHHVSLTIGNMTFSPVQVEGGGNIQVDDELSTTSINPVQNKVITNEVYAIKEDVDDKSESIEKALQQSNEAHDVATQASNYAVNLSQQVSDLSEKVDKVENGDIVWNDVE